MGWPCSPSGHHQCPGLKGSSWGVELQWSPGRCGRDCGLSQPLTAAGTTFRPQHSLTFLPWGPVGSSTKGWEGLCGGACPVSAACGAGRGLSFHPHGEWRLQPPETGNWSPSLESGLAESAKAGDLPRAMKFLVSPRGTCDWSPEHGAGAPSGTVMGWVLPR